MLKECVLFWFEVWLNHCYNTVSNPNLLHSLSSLHHSLGFVWECGARERSTFGEVTVGERTPQKQNQKQTPFIIVVICFFGFMTVVIFITSQPTHFPTLTSFLHTLFLKRFLSFQWLELQHATFLFFFLRIQLAFNTNYLLLYIKIYMLQKYNFEMIIKFKNLFDISC